MNRLGKRDQEADGYLRFKQLSFYTISMRPYDDDLVASPAAGDHPPEMRLAAVDLTRRLRMDMTPTVGDGLASVSTPSQF